MKIGNKGFTLVEIIVSLAIVGIIAAGIIPLFGMQYKMTLDTKNITTSVFEAQGEMENNIFTLKEALINNTEGTITEVTAASVSVLGTDVTLYKLKDVFSSNENKSFTVYLSKTLAINENRPLLDMTGVRITVLGRTSGSSIAYLEETNPAPKLLGEFDTFAADSAWVTNIFKWYVSDEGDTDPVFPDDYTRINQTGDPRDHYKLDNLTKFANRYIEFTVTPVDVNGIRGKETRSGNPVYVAGIEWRAGLFPWFDKNEDASIGIPPDVPVDKWTILNGESWPLIEGLDASHTFLNSNGDNLDPSNGSLYVPMRCGPVIVPGDKFIEWKIDKSIHLATDILVNSNNTNNTHEDLIMEVKEGNIIFYQFLELDVNGLIIDDDDNGIADTIDEGSRVATSSASIFLQTSGRGNIILQDSTELDSGNDISLIPYGNISMYDNFIKAKGKIVLDTTKGDLFPGNRDILLKGTEIIGTNNGQSIVEISAKNNVTLSTVNLQNCYVTLNNNTTMLGGSWDNQSEITVANGKTLKVEYYGGHVMNNGSLNLGDTGRILFANTDSNDLRNNLDISLTPAGNSSPKVIISTNYQRNIDYADVTNLPESVSLAGSYQNLGLNQSNLEFKVTGNTSDLSRLTYEFNNADDTVTIAADATTATALNLKLTVRDKYSSPAIYRTVNFRVNSIGAGPATVIFDGMDAIDDTVPVITLNGPNPQIVSLGHPYNEQGATVTDNLDTNLNVIINSAVNVNILGDYLVTYNAIDSNGNRAIQVTRTVIVTDQIAPTASVVTALVKIGNNVTTAQSTELGTIYLVKTTVTPTNATALEAAVIAGTAKKITVTAPNSNTSISTTGLSAGTYVVYAVDEVGNMSAASQGIITLYNRAPRATAISDGNRVITTVTYDLPISNVVIANIVGGYYPKAVITNNTIKLTNYDDSRQRSQDQINFPNKTNISVTVTGSDGGMSTTVIYRNNKDWRIISNTDL